MREECRDYKPMVEVTTLRGLEGQSDLHQMYLLFYFSLERAEQCNLIISLILGLQVPHCHKLHHDLTSILVRTGKGLLH